MKFNSKALPITSRALFTIVGGAVLINPVFAQEQASEELEEVVVTGLRGSLKASMETKRDAVGVVDAINAEDIGKFPDTNLSEALQRITGVSIDRRNGEGATRHGSRLRPAVQHGYVERPADAGGRHFGGGDAITGGVGGNTRSFNFAQSRGGSDQRGRGVQDRSCGHRHGRHRCVDQRAHCASARQRRHGAQPRRQGGQRHDQSCRRRLHSGSVGHLQLRQRRQDLRLRRLGELPEARQRFIDRDGQRLAHPAVGRFERWRQSRSNASAARQQQQHAGDAIDDVIARRSTTRRRTASSTASRTTSVTRSRIPSARAPTCR